MKKTITLLALLIGFSLSAQETKASDYLNEVKTLDSTIKTLYAVISGDKGVERNWELFKYLFHHDAKLIPTGKNQDGQTVVRYMTADDYISNSGKWLRKWIS